MKNLFTLLIIIGIATAVQGQGQQPQKIKIALLGTLHFTPSKQDTYKNEAVDLSSQKRQKEIEEVVGKITKFNPDQICVEIPVSAQRRTDSTYNLFLKDNYKLEQDEIDQLGFKSAQKLNLKGVTCINYKGKFDTDPVTKFAQEHNQTQILSGMDECAKGFMSEINQKQNALSIKDFSIFINSPAALNKNLSFYTKYLIKIGEDQNYVGTDVVTDWYNTNLHIYTNILRSIRPTDKTILVIFGQGHIPILKHLFESNPDFEVVEIKDVLK